VSGFNMFDGSNIFSYFHYILLINMWLKAPLIKGVGGI